jgi:hypothetical protein
MRGSRASCKPMSQKRDMGHPDVGDPPGIQLVGCGGGQVGRFACGFTPAFGRAVGSSIPVVYLGLRPRLVCIGPLALGMWEEFTTCAGFGLLAFASHARR